MAASLNDQALLAADPAFQGRVKESVAATCVAIANEATSTAFHFKRAQFAVQVLTGLNAGNTPNWVVLFSQAVATDANVIADATVGGTVALTSGTAATQAALVTDTHINNAISGQFNSFFVPF